MAKIVGVHGISQEFRGSNTIKADWLPALKDGLALVDYPLESDEQFTCAFYGDLFRGETNIKAKGIPNYDYTDVETDWEKELLQKWSEEVVKVEEGTNDISNKKARIPKSVQQALRVLSDSEFFGNVAEKLIIYFLKQVAGYLHDPNLRNDIQQRVIDVISDETKVLVGHSLGSIVCYEVLCQHPEWSVTTFVTLGSPLGIKRLIFDRLEPPPVDKIGKWPGSVKNWINIADQGDIVALEKHLNPLFDGFVDDKTVYNGSEAHYATNYLTARETGEAIKSGLID